MAKHKTTKEQRKKDSAFRREYYRQDPKKFQKRTKKWQLANPEKFKLMCRRSNLKRTWGLTLEQKAQIVKSQNNRCAICSNIFQNKICIDHDHNTGKIRQLLCVACNAGIGNFKENILILKSAISYIEKWKGV